MLQVSALTKVGGSPSTSYSYNGYTYQGSFYIDPIYAGMHPIFCASRRCCVWDLHLSRCVTYCCTVCVLHL